MIRLALLLPLLAACQTPEGNCRAAQATYLAMVGGGAPAGALEMAQADVAEICRPMPRP